MKPQFWLLYVGLGLFALAQVSHAARPWLNRISELDPSKPIAHFTGQRAFDHCEDMAPAAKRQGAQQWSCAGPKSNYY